MRDALATALLLGAAVGMVAGAAPAQERGLDAGDDSLIGQDERGAPSVHILDREDDLVTDPVRDDTTGTIDLAADDEIAGTDIVEEDFLDVEGDDEGLADEEFDLREDDLGLEDEEIVDDDIGLGDRDIGVETGPSGTQRDLDLGDDRLGADLEPGLDQEEFGIDDDLGERDDLDVDRGIGGDALGTGRTGAGID